MAKATIVDVPIPPFVKILSSALEGGDKVRIKAEVRINPGDLIEICRADVTDPDASINIEIVANPGGSAPPATMQKVNEPITLPVAMKNYLIIVRIKSNNKTAASDCFTVSRPKVDGEQATTKAAKPKPRRKSTKA